MSKNIFKILLSMLIFLNLQTDAMAKQIKKNTTKQIKNKNKKTILTKKNENSSLEKISPTTTNLEQIFITDLRHDENFLNALEHSIAYYNTILDSKEKFQYGKESYTPLQMVQSLTIFKKLTQKEQSFESFLIELSEQFDIYKTSSNTNKSLVTGYYTPLLKGSKKATKTYDYPLFLSNNHTTTPDFYVTSRNDVLALEIEGSGILKLDSGERYTLAYASRRNQPILVRQKNKNKIVKISKPVFKISNKEPSGSLAVPLTANYTVAMDKKATPLGSLIYVRPLSIGTQIADNNEISTATKGGFMLVQDTGKSIKGAGRVDLYCGVGDEGKNTLQTIKKSASVFMIVAKKDILQDYFNQRLTETLETKQDKSNIIIELKEE